MIEVLDHVLSGTVFEPEIVQMLASAFEDAWERLEQSGRRFARPGYARAMREVIAKRIVEMAQQGVTDPQALADDAIRFVRAITKTVSATSHSERRSLRRGPRSRCKIPRQYCECRGRHAFIRTLWRDSKGTRPCVAFLSPWRRCSR
jgi:hypothetical protein